MIFFINLLFLYMYNLIITKIITSYSKKIINIKKNQNYI